MTVMVGWMGDLTRAGDPPPTESKSGAEQTAQQPAGKPGSPESTGTESKKVATAKARAAQKTQIPPGRSPGLAIRRMLRAFDRLQSQMTAELNLNDRQKTKIAQVFDRYRKDIQDPTVKPSLHQGGSDEEAPLRVSTEEHLKRKIDAQRGKIKPAEVPPAASGKSRPRATVFDAAPLITEELTHELDFEQRKPFEKMALRWTILQPTAGLRDGPLQRLTRASKDPMLDITEAERTELFLQIDEKAKEARELRRANPVADLQPLADEVRPELLKKLTPAQQEHFSKTFQALEAEAAAEAADEAKRAEAAKQSEKAPEITDK